MTHINQIVEDNLTLASVVLLQLSKDDITVLNIQLWAGSKPTIFICKHPICQKLVNKGMAAYYKFGTDETGPYQQGQFELLGCRVVWSEPRTERIH